MTQPPCNIVIAGLGGQGVIRASDVLAEAAFLAGHDVKKSELHGMAQRGGSVYGDVRFGERVLSPMITPGEADWLVVLEASEVAPHRHRLRPEGRVLGPESVDLARLPSRKSLNVALLALLARELELPLEAWLGALERHFEPALAAPNRALFVELRGVVVQSPSSP